MNGLDIVKQFESINTWKSKGVRAPHKPLLMLLVLEATGGITLP